MRIGVLTGGGDAPGLNAAIRAIVLRSASYGHSVVGIRDGWAGLLGDGATRDLEPEDVEDILSLGGTILGTSRTNPRDPRARQQVLENIRRYRIDALIAIGGNDTLGVAAWLEDEGVAVVGVPKTVDNDIAETDHCIGFDTAVAVVANALDRLRTTASAHHRAMLVEVMGRDTGWVAALGGLAGGADIILIPELPTNAAGLVRAVQRRHALGQTDTIIVVAESIEMHDLTGVREVLQQDAFGHKRLDQRGIGDALARHIEQVTGFETRAVVLGHLQRGGSPTAIDRLWATRFGDAAVDLVNSGRFGHLPVARGGSIEVTTLSAAVATTRGVPADIVELIRRLAWLEPAGAREPQPAR
jgi:phosphofructokinase-like protein